MEERRAKLADPARRRALRDNLPMVATAPIDTITVLGPRSPATEPYREMSVGQVAELTGKHPVDALLDVAVADDLATLFFVAPPQGGDADLLREIVQSPYLLLGVSDGGAHTKFLTAGRYPTETLAEHVREREWLSVEEAHWRLSALPAKLAGFRGRGTLQEGSPADVVVYDYENLKVLPTEVAHDLPGGEWRRVQRADGYRWVLVNGEVTVEDDREVANHSGRLLRHGG